MTNESAEQPVGNAEQQPETSPDEAVFKGASYEEKLPSGGVQPQDEPVETSPPEAWSTNDFAQAQSMLNKSLSMLKTETDFVIPTVADSNEDGSPASWTVSPDPQIPEFNVDRIHTRQFLCGCFAVFGCGSICVATTAILILQDMLK